MNLILTKEEIEAFNELHHYCQGDILAFLCKYDTAILPDGVSVRERTAPIIRQRTVAVKDTLFYTIDEYIATGFVRVFRHDNGQIMEVLPRKADFNLPYLVTEWRDLAFYRIEQYLREKEKKNI
jgi:hypothetical protein